MAKKKARSFRNEPQQKPVVYVIGYVGTEPRLCGARIRGPLDRDGQMLPEDFRAVMSMMNWASAAGYAAVHRTEHLPIYGRIKPARA